MSELEKVLTAEGPKIELVAELIGVGSFRGFGSDEIAAYAARGDFDFESSAGLARSENSALILPARKYNSHRKTAGVIKRSFGRGHGSVGDMSAFAFSIENLTRAATLQLCLPEYLEHEQQSLRRVKAGRGVYFPRAIEESRLKESAEKVLENSVALYKKMADSVPEEDARFVLPLLTRTNITTKGNARELIHLCTMNGQGEVPSYVRQVVSEMIRQAKESAPNLFERGALNYETLGFYPSAILYASENCTLNELISKHGEHRVKYVEYEISGEAASKAYKDKREEELANLKHVTDGKTMRGFLFQISLAGFHQTIRQRTWRHTCESIYDAAKRGDVLTPSSVENSRYSEDYANQCRDMLEVYSELAKEIPRAEAVGVVPHAMMLYDFITIDGWNAAHAIGKRTCLQAQWEIRSIANQIASYFRKINSPLGKHMQPQCLTYGFCPEEKPACQIYNRLQQQGKLNQKRSGYERRFNKF